MKRALLLLAALALAGCGAHTRALPPVAPAYPGATGAATRANATFSTTDWTLPAGTHATAVYDWYVARLTKLGWKITQQNETGVHADKGDRTLDGGVRGSTLEVNKG
jgi:ABC-type glycerol-3-phosphate transport system substrate-binding protein